MKIQQNYRTTVIKKSISSGEIENNYSQNKTVELK